MQQSQGLNLIPLKEKSKLPLIEWKKWQIEKYTEFIPMSSNYAVITGKISNNTVVIDVDKCHDPNVLKKILPDALNKTLVVKTGKGYHIYVKVEKLPNTLRLDNHELHIDVQASGVYVVGPGSIHPDGPTYEIISNTEKITTIDFQIIDNNLKKLGLKTESMQKGSEIAKGNIDVGNRHNSALKYANNLLFKEKLDESVVISDMSNWNKRLPEPLPEYEINQIIKDAVNYHSKKTNKG